MNLIRLLIPVFAVKTRRACIASLLSSKLGFLIGLKKRWFLPLCSEAYDLSLRSVIALVLAEEEGEGGRRALRFMESTSKFWSSGRRRRKTVAWSGVPSGFCDPNFIKRVVGLVFQNLEVRWVLAMVFYVVFVHFKCMWELTLCGFSSFSIENLIDSCCFFRLRLCAERQQDLRWWRWCALS